MNLCFVIIATMCVTTLFAQKRPLDHKSFDSWERIVDKDISNNGRFVLYSIEIPSGGSTTVLATTDGTWKMQVEGVSSPQFTVDSRFVLYKSKADSLQIVDLRKSKVRSIADVASFKLPKFGDGRYVAYKLRTVNKKSSDSLVLLNLRTGVKIDFGPVSSYYFNRDGSVLLLTAVDRFSKKNCIVWANLLNGARDTISKSAGTTSGFAFDDSGLQLAYVEHCRTGVDRGASTCLRYFHPSFDSSTIVVSTKTPGMDGRFNVCSNKQPKFAPSGKQILFGVEVADSFFNFEPAREGKGSVRIWNYKDEQLVSLQQNDANSASRNKCLVAAYNLSGKVVRLQDMDIDPATDNVILPFSSGRSLALSFSTAGYRSEAAWLLYPRKNYKLIDTRLGDTIFCRNGYRGSGLHLSPNARYVVWYDPDCRQYYLYSVLRDSIEIVSESITTALYDDEFDRGDDPPAFGIAGWGADDDKLFIYDRFDIWEISLSSSKKATRCVTNQLGRRSKTIFRFYKHPFDRGYIAGNEIFQRSETLLLKSFNKETKYSGFYSKTLSVNSDPTLLSSGPYSYTFIKRAAYKDKYIVGRTSVSECENIYSTRDFKNFRKISFLNIQQNDYNWMTCDLIRWEMPNGEIAEGLLYKPENFDPGRKYPVIFHFYEKDSDNLFKYQIPSPSNGTLNVAYYVSNGYLVFDPDIYFKVGAPGESACRSVLSSVGYLSQFPWVDTSRMGIQGHSFGGYEVNYIITRTNVFKAASVSSAVSNILSGLGNLKASTDVGNTYWYYEIGQGRLGGNLWSSPERYFMNSPLLFADKINTPLLLMHNKEDAQIPFTNSVELFSALKRLGKEVWMLEYRGEGHSIIERDNQIDFSVRLSQFFDFYLKNYPAPHWLRSRDKSQIFEGN